MGQQRCSRVGFMLLAKRLTADQNVLRKGAILGNEMLLTSNDGTLEAVQSDNREMSCSRVPAAGTAKLISVRADRGDVARADPS